MKGVPLVILLGFLLVSLLGCWTWCDDQCLRETIELQRRASFADFDSLK